MSIKVFLGMCVAVFIMASCSNSPAPKSKAKIKVKPAIQQEVLKNSAYYLQQARKAFEINSDTFQRNALLIKAAETLQAEQKHVQSVKLIKVLVPEIQNPRQLSHAYLVMAESYLTVSADNIVLIGEITKKINPAHVPSARLASITSKVLLAEQKWLKAANSLLKTNLNENDKSQQIWDAIEHLSLKDLEAARWKYDVLLPWIKLAIITQRYALNSDLLSQQVLQWKSENKGHSLQQNFPKNLTLALEQQPLSPKRIAVLLPLTGRLASQGQVLKDGFLSAYLQASEKNTRNDIQNNNSSKPNKNPAFQEVRFFNSALKTAKELNDLVVDYDLVVGPLVKEKIQALSLILPANKVLLALNRIDLKRPTQIDSVSQIETSSLPKEHYYFSLAPEDEAEQLAQYIHRKQLSRPIIFADDNNVTKRMAQAFIQEWKNISGTVPPELTIFKNNKEMRTSVASMLDVIQSKNRIKKIERLADVEVFSNERNRRDIDAIVLFANPEQTALLTPIIEASMSSFAEVSVSVFASSRSYSQNQTTGNLRDLRNLTFSEMPWLLPNHKWQNLSDRTSQLWPQRQDSLARLFAMGFDTYNFIPQLRHLKALPQARAQGLTGQIKLQPSGVIHRRLPLAQVTRDKVVLVEMD